MIAHRGSELVGKLCKKIIVDNAQMVVILSIESCQCVIGDDFHVNYLYLSTYRNDTTWTKDVGLK